MLIAARPLEAYPATGPSPPSSPAASSRIMRHEKAVPKRHRLPPVRRASPDLPVNGFLQPSPSLHAPGSPLISNTPSSSIPTGLNLPPHLRSLRHLGDSLASPSEQHGGPNPAVRGPLVGHPAHRTGHSSAGLPLSIPSSPQLPNGCNSSLPPTPVSVSPDPSRLPPGICLQPACPPAFFSSLSGFQCCLAWRLGI